MNINAIWSNFHQEYKETSANYFEWIPCVDVSVAIYNLTFSIDLPKAMAEADISTYLAGSKEVEDKIKKAAKIAKSGTFSIDVGV